MKNEKKNGKNKNFSGCQIFIILNIIESFPQDLVYGLLKYACLRKDE